MFARKQPGFSRKGLVVTFLRLASVCFNCFTQKVLAKQAFLFLMVGELLVRSL